MIKTHYKTISVLLLYVIFLVAFGLNDSIWIDEGYTILTTSHKIKDISGISLRFELQPPIYFLLLKVWGTISNSIIWLRLFSALTSILSIILFAKLLKIFVDRFSVAFVALFAFNPITIWASLEIRSYSLMVLCAILITLNFYKIYLSDEKVDKKKRIAFSLLGVICIWINYYLAVILLSNWIVLIMAKEKKSIKLYFIDMLLPLFSMLVLIPFFTTQLDYYTKGLEKLEGLKAVLQLIYNRLENYLFAARMLPLLPRYFVRIFFFIVLAIKVKDLIKTENRKTKYLIYHSFSLIAILTIMAPLVNMNMLKERHLLFIVPVILILFFLVISKHKPVVCYLAISVIAISYSYNLFNNYVLNIPNNGIQTSALMIKQNEIPKKENVVIYRNELELVFRNYYEGENEIFTLPFRISVDKSYNHKLWNLKSIEEIDSIFSKIKLSESIWLLSDTYHTIVFGVDYNYDILDKYIEKNYTIKYDTIHEDGIRLRHLNYSGNKISDNINPDDSS